MATWLGWRLSVYLRHAGVVVLMYHRINSDTDIFPGLPLAQFRRQMEWLSRNCTPIWPEDLFDAARYGSRIRPPVVVTFDDGYKDYFDNAYPVLREFRIPAVLFLATDLIDRGKLLWTESLHWAASQTRKQSLSLPWQLERIMPLNTRAERLEFIDISKAYLKSIPEQERRRWVSLILEQLEVPFAEEKLGRQMLTWDEVRAVREGTRIGGHSHTHPILSRLTSGEMEREILNCRDRIASETGERPVYFAYPNGQVEDFNGETKQLLVRYGFEVAFSTVEGINGPGADPLELRRRAAGGTSIGDFAARVGLK